MLQWAQSLKLPFKKKLFEAAKLQAGGKPSKDLGSGKWTPDMIKIMIKSLRCGRDPEITKKIFLISM